MTGNDTTGIIVTTGVVILTGVAVPVTGVPIKIVIFLVGIMDQSQGMPAMIRLVVRLPAIRTDAILTGENQRADAATTTGLTEINAKSVLIEEDKDLDIDPAAKLRYTT